MPWMLRSLFICVALLFAAAHPPAIATEPDDAWKIWQSDGVHALMRHAIAPGTGDPANFTLGDCTTQRNLDATGQDQARQAGDRIREMGIKVDTILTSQWCRCLETAQLLDLGSPTEEPALNSFFQDRSTRTQQTEQIKQRLVEIPDGQKVVLVTHQVNITALTDIFPRSGEIILFRLNNNGNDVEVLGRIMP